MMTVGDCYYSRLGYPYVLKRTFDVLKVFAGFLADINA